MLPFCKTICILLLISGSLAKSKEDEAKREIKEAKKTAKLPPCAACNALVSSFQAGMKRTSRGKLGGGDTAWEEKNQVYTTRFLKVNIELLLYIQFSIIYIPY